MTANQVAYYKASEEAKHYRNLDEQQALANAEQRRHNYNTEQVAVKNYEEQARTNRAQEGIGLLNYQETQRSNIAQEFETNRSHLANEYETHRANLARENETARANRAKEYENQRSNMAKESLTLRFNEGQIQHWMNQDRLQNYSNATNRMLANEQVRHDIMNEYLGSYDSATQRINALTRGEELAETQRRNLVLEDQGQSKLNIDRLSALQGGAISGSQYQETVRKDKASEEQRSDELTQKYVDTIGGIINKATESTGALATLIKFF